MTDAKKRVSLNTRCTCGALMTIEDCTFWGECKNCRTQLPVESRQQGDGTVLRTERDYHGGLFHRGEW
jgi:hypothetical protein